MIDEDGDGGYRLVLAQLRIEGGDVAGNRRRAMEAVGRAADRGADLVALPELFTAGYFAFDRYEETAEGLDGETLTRIGELAADRGVAVLAGTVVEDLAATADAEPDVETPADEGLANTAVLFDSDGERRLVYRKHHLFGYESAESELLVPGERLETAEIGPFTVGVTTCYDLRFPELYRRLVERGATLVVVPSAWPYPRLDHWRTLSRARAIENQWYLATANGSGSFGGERLVGESTVYDPWGTPVAASGDEPTTVVADLDPGRVREVRGEFPALSDRRY
ncbi:MULTISPECIES: carbon-nitrogen family hydrolase [Saliphagus]|uniref:Carbon-nitrogen family hydrolase n=1 Tax=Saliphagus infecundisoli TaxID=1849069 RepID=A0ABD5QJL5_9EURY|nr:MULTISPECIES: carbon-nitrogen family hydrolase [Saliphagus]